MDLMSACIFAKQKPATIAGFYSHAGRYQETGVLMVKYTNVVPLENIQVTNMALTSVNFPDVLSFG